MLFQFDRVYLGPPNIVAVLDHERRRTYVIRREGLSDVGKIDCSLRVHQVYCV